MSHKSESEEDSDLEQQEELKPHHKKPHFTTMPRPQDVKRKKIELNEEDYEFDSDEGEMVLRPEKAQELAEIESEEEVEEDDFQRQLRLEREEAERIKKLEKEEKKTKIDPDGTEYEWDPVVKGWFPKIPDKKFIEYQQTSYTASYNKPLPNKYYLFNGAFFKWDFDNNKWVPSDTAVYAYIDYMTGISYEWNQEAKQWQPTPGQQPIIQPSSQTASATTASTASSNVKPVEQATDKNKKREGWIDLNEDKNTNVYVSNLPLDITEEEFEEIMSKYGIIMKDPLTHKLKIKLYRENDEVKGDGRCCYLMPESVKLCLQLLDGLDYRGKKIKVEKAKFEMKGTFDPAKAKTNDQIKKLNKKKLKEQIEKQRQRLLDWEERPEIQRQKHEKVVVIKGLFSIDDMKKDPNLKKKLKEELNKELTTYGDVKKVLIHDIHPEGIATVSFREIEMADECVDYLDNRVWKNGRVIKCETWDGKTKYVVEETEEEMNRRIEEWHRFLEADE